MPAKNRKRDFGALAQIAAANDTKKLDHPDDIKKSKEDRWQPKLFVTISREIFQRLDDALYFENKKGENKEGKPAKVTKSIIVEKAVDAWLKKNKY